MHIMAGTVELINIENYGCCLLNLATGEKELHISLKCRST